jgi:type 2 lantibiotic biosynthesis protein LanM
MENVVATADGPVLVDVELMLQPARESERPGAPGPGEAEAHPARESCLTTGLLSMFETASSGAVFDVGGLRGEGVGVRTLARRVWHRSRSEDLYFKDEMTFAEPTPNRVLFKGVVQRADDHAADILAGFADTYHFLMTHRQDLLDPDGPLATFAGGRTRVVPRPTNQYALLSAVLRAPRYQRDGAERSAAMDILLRPFNRSSSRPRVWPVLLEERRALDALDVPLFWVSCGGTEACAGSGVVAHDYFARSGLDAVRDRIRSLSDRDLRRQERLLARALAESPASRFASSPPSADDGPAGFVEAATWIGRELQRVDPACRSEASDAAPGACPHLLYDGTLGPALLFAALHAVTKDAGWADDAQAALEPVRAAVGHGEFADWTEDGIGAADGLGSVVYGLALASSFLNDASLLEASMTVASHLSGRIEQDRHLDVLSGAAGAILALLALHEARRDPVLLEWAHACGAHLIARQTTVGDGSAWVGTHGHRVVGFAHGAAGIAFALHRLFERTGEPAVGQAALRGYRYERRRYLAGEGNWSVADVPDDHVTGASPSMMAWCNGGPGVALANAAALDRLGDGAAGEIDAALSAAARWIPSRPDHICCGTLGRSDILLTVGRQADRPEAVTAAHALAGRVTARASGRTFSPERARLRIPGVRCRFLSRAVGHRICVAANGRTGAGAIGAVV